MTPTAGGSNVFTGTAGNTAPTFVTPLPALVETFIDAESTVLYLLDNVKEVEGETVKIEVKFGSNAVPGRFDSEAGVLMITPLASLGALPGTYTIEVTLTDDYVGNPMFSKYIIVVKIAVPEDYESEGDGSEEIQESAASEDSGEEVSSSTGEEASSSTTETSEDVVAETIEYEIFDAEFVASLTTS